jgi:hypothetical protein
LNTEIKTAINDIAKTEINNSFNSSDSSDDCGREDVDDCYDNTLKIYANFPLGEIEVCPRQLLMIYF